MSNVTPIDPIHAKEHESLIQDLEAFLEDVRQNKVTAFVLVGLLDDGQLARIGVQDTTEDSVPNLIVTGMLQKAAIDFAQPWDTPND